MGNFFSRPKTYWYQASIGSVIVAKCIISGQSCEFILSSMENYKDNKSNLALHVSVFPGNFLIFKSRIDGKWKQEVRVPHHPVKPRSEFTFKIIKKTHASFEISIDDHFSQDYPCNEATDEVNHFIIAGDVTTKDVKFSTNNPTPVLTPCVVPDAPPPPYFQVDNRAMMYQTVPYTMQGKTVHNPAVPFVNYIKGIMRIGAVFTIQGTPNHRAKRFSVGLSCGSHDTADQTLHIAVHFDDAEDKFIVARSFRRGGSFIGVQSNQTFFPFHLGVPFVMTISVRAHEFEININNLPFTRFTHQIEIERADHLVISGDLEVAQVDLY